MNENTPTAANLWCYPGGRCKCSASNISDNCRLDGACAYGTG